MKKITKYKDAFTAKLENKRVTVIKNSDGFSIEFWRVSENPGNTAIMKRIQGKVNYTCIYLSDESAAYLFEGLGQFIKREVKRAAIEQSNLD